MNREEVRMPWRHFVEAWLARGTIRSRLIVLLLLFVIAPMLTLVVLYGSYSQKALLQEVNASNRHTLETYSSSVNKTMESVLSASNIIAQDGRLQEIIHAREAASPYSQFVGQEEIKKKLTDVKYYILQDGEVTLYDDACHAYSTAEVEAGQACEEPWYRQTIEKNGYIQWFPLDRNDTSQLRPSINITRLIPYGSGGSRNAVLRIQLQPEQFLPKEAASGHHAATIHLVDADRRVLASTDSAGVGQLLPEEAVSEPDETILLPRHGWMLVLQVDQALLNQGLRQVLLIAVVIVGVLMSLFLALISLFSMMMTKPIMRLERSLSRMDHGNLNLQPELSGPREIRSLTLHFNRMVQRLSDSLQRVDEERGKKETARLEALQAQINPHFLLNTLNTIKWSAYMSQAPHVGEMISNLGKLLEISLHRSDELHPLAEEAEHLRVYMQLQKLRFQDRLELEIELEPEASRALLPKLTLQPIVENSILHGFANMQTVGRIHIHARAECGRVRLAIRDNGSGMTEETMREVSGLLTASGQERFSGIGLRNVHERIQLYFGRDYGLSIAGIPGSGTTVTLDIPLPAAERGGQPDESNGRG
jgi:two-component system sensor histidine kinase YesM